MKLIFAAAVVLLSALAVSPALSLSNRTNVASTGTDTGSCSVTAPCRTFAYAIQQTAAKGQIVVLDTAGYGPVTINKAISIINDSNTAVVNSPSGYGISINAGANDTVSLRGLTIDGLGTGGIGISLVAAGKVNIVNCIVQNFTSPGMSLSLTTSVLLRIADTSFVNNQYYGFYYSPSGGSGNTNTVTAIIERTTFFDNGQGGVLFYTGNAGGAVKLAMSQVTVTNNDGDGLRLEGGYQPLSATINSSFIANNRYAGIYQGSFSTLIVGRTVSTGNGTGINHNAGTLYSYRNNEVNGNTNDFVGAAAIQATPL